MTAAAFFDKVPGVTFRAAPRGTPGEPRVSGAKLGPWLEAFPVIKAFEFDFDRIEVGGDVAAGVGSGAWTIEQSGEDVSATFKFVDVFRRSADGKWRYAHVIWNFDTATG